MSKIAENSAAKLITAKNCSIAIGLPTSISDFNLSLENSKNSYGHSFAGGWEQYKYQWLDPFTKFSNECCCLGVTFELTSSLHDLCEAFRRPHLHVFLLLSHWHSSEIEWCGKFESTYDFIQVMPPDFNGVIDLCICHPNTLAEQLGILRPSCLVRYTPTKVNPDRWLPYFKGIFRLLNTGKYSYITAHEALGLQMAKKYSRQS